MSSQLSDSTRSHGTTGDKQASMHARIASSVQQGEERMLWSKAGRVQLPSSGSS